MILYAYSKIVQSEQSIYLMQCYDYLYFSSISAKNSYLRVVWAERPGSSSPWLHCIYIYVYLYHTKVVILIQAWVEVYLLQLFYQALVVVYSI
jgi:hypothetical protein